MVGKGELHDMIAKNKKRRKKEKGQEENAFFILGLPLGSDGHRVARKIRGRVEGSRRCGGQMPICVLDGVSSWRMAEALPRPGMNVYVQGLRQSCFFVFDFRAIGEVDPHGLNENTYVVLSHLLSFSPVPKPIFSKHVPFCEEAVHGSLSGFLLSLSRVPGRGLLVNNLTCKATDLRRGSFVIHIVDGVLMDFEFEQSMSQERAPANSEDSDLAGEHEGEQEQKEVPK